MNRSIFRLIMASVISFVILFPFTGYAETEQDLCIPINFKKSVEVTKLTQPIIDQDISKYDNWLSQLAYWVEDEWGYLRLFPGIEHRKKLIGDQREFYYVVHYGDVPIATFALVPESPKVMELYSVYVSPSVRNCGIGGLIVEKAKEISQSKGCDILILDTLKPNLNTFYKKYGAIICGESRFLGSPCERLAIRLG